MDGGGGGKGVEVGRQSEDGDEVGRRRVGWESGVWVGRGRDALSGLGLGL